MKKAVLENMRAIGKEAGLKSFEQVRNILIGFDTSTYLLTTLLFCQVKCLYLHPEMFSVANGLLTPTLKSRRADIRRVFQGEIASMYSKTAV